jgi:hypothetical protein
MRVTSSYRMFLACFFFAAALLFGARQTLAGQAALSWKAPTVHTDGTPLYDLAGYKIYIGNTSCRYLQSIDVGNVTNYQINNLIDGAPYYFAVSAYSSSRSESAYSNETGKLLPPYLIIATYGSGGTVTAQNNPNVAFRVIGTSTRAEVTVSDGASQTFSIAAAYGNSISDVRVDGSSVGPVTSYTFNTVKAGHTLDVTFSGGNNATYTITSSSGAGGSITPSGSIVLPAGAGESYNIVPSAGYSIADVKVDGTSVGRVTSYSFTNVTANHTIQASFAAKVGSYTITASAGSGGSITPFGTVTVAAGASQSFAITPAGGYRISDVRVDGVSVGSVSSYNFPNVSGNHTIQASFAANVGSYTITASAGSGGSIAPSGTVTVAAGASQSFTISAAAGYGISDVRVDGVSVGRVSSYNFPNVSGNHTIQASFAATGATSFAVNSGGPRYISRAGVTYLADIYYSGGLLGSTSFSISGTSDPTLYVTERYGNFSYNIPLANGKYDVTLKFVEFYFSRTGRRVFDVAIGGTVVISNLDVYAVAGKNVAYDVVVPAIVTNGVLNISFISKIDLAKVSAIKVSPSSVAAAMVAESAPAPAPDAASVRKRGSGDPPPPVTVDATSLIPADRVATWTGNVGVTGEIPSRSAICATLSPSGADDTSAIQGAIRNCSSGGVVSLAAGTFTVSSAIVMKSGITLRGAGMGRTVVKGAAGLSAPYLVGFDAGSWLESGLPAGAPLVKDATTVTTQSPHGWSVGDVIVIDQLNNPTGTPAVTNQGTSGVCSWCGRANGNRSLGQLARITVIPSPTTAILETPLLWNYNSSLSPELARNRSMTSAAGIEDLTLDNSTSGSVSQTNDGATVAFYGAADCWLLRVEAIGSYTTMVRIKRGYRNTVRGCVFHEGVPALPINHPSYGTSRAYGIWIGPGSGNLIEGNKVYHLFMPFKLDSSTSGNVISYNYASELYYTNTNWNLGVVNMHGGHPGMNLVEQNYSDGRLLADDVWGSSSHNTFFRNRHSLTPGKTGAAWDIDLQKNAQFYNVVGNVIGISGIENSYQLNNVDLNGQAGIFRFGYLADGDGSAAGNDPQVAATAVLNGNWDSFNRSVMWNGGPMPLPASMYLTGKPGWWGTRAWPAVGPDLSPMYPAAPGICNGMPWDDGAAGSSRPAPPASLNVQ